MSRNALAAWRADEPSQVAACAQPGERCRAYRKVGFEATSQKKYELVPELVYIVMNSNTITTECTAYAAAPSSTAVMIYIL